eukprot:5381866-Pleurochrysis_carterae.AAC.1
MTVHKYLSGARESRNGIFGLEVKTLDNRTRSRRISLGHRDIANCARGFEARNVLMGQVGYKSN